MVLATIKSANLSDYELAIACSGGLDSTVLIHACQLAGLQPRLIHINYHLRGEDSNGDEQFVRDLGEKFNFPVEVHDCPTEITKGEGINLQLAARNFRHSLFQNWLAEDSNRRVLLAHHQDDQVETFFLQLARGSGSFGLGGMHPESNGLIRPFLNLSKKQLQEFALSNNINWREDSSNQKSDYSRNKLRNIILPELEKSIPDLVTSVTLLQHYFREKQTKLLHESEVLIEQFRQNGEIDFSTWNRLDLLNKLLIFKTLNISLHLISRIDELEKAELSAVLDENQLIRTKHGFSWLLEFPFKNRWEFKSETIENLPKSFNAQVLYLDNELFNDLPKIEFANENDSIQKIGNKFRSKVFKLMKDSGIPKQWRSTYPVLKVENEIVWIPFIAVSGKYLAQNQSTNILKFSLNTEK